MGWEGRPSDIDGQMEAAQVHPICRRAIFSRLSGLDDGHDVLDVHTVLVELDG